MPSLTSERDRVELKSEQSVPKMAWYLNPYLHIGLNVILTAIANILGNTITSARGSVENKANEIVSQRMPI